MCIRDRPYGHPDFNGRRRDYASAILPEEGHYALPLFGSPLRPQMCIRDRGRLDRHLGEPSTAAYGREELVAEFSAALVGLGLGVSSGIRAENVAYLKDWLRAVSYTHLKTDSQWCKPSFAKPANPV